MKKNISLSVLFFVLIAIISGGCSTAPEKVKQLGVELHDASKEKKQADKAIYDYVKKLTDLKLNSVILSYKERLQKEYLRNKFRILQKADEKLWKQYSENIAEMEQTWIPL